MTDYSSPYQALTDLADRSRHQAAGLPQQETFAETWIGVAFHIAGHSLVSPMNQVTELLTPPSYTRLPGVKSWVLGVANVRGRLVPLIDLCEFLGLPHQGHRQSRRVLIVEQGDILVGLLVDHVVGMQHFNTDDQMDSADTLPTGLEDYIDGAYQKNNAIWHLFSMTKLISQEKFMQVAA